MEEIQEFTLFIAIFFNDLKDDCNWNNEIIDEVKYKLNIEEFIDFITKYHDIKNYHVSDFQFGKQIDYNDDNDRILVMDENNFSKYIRNKAND